MEKAKLVVKQKEPTDWVNSIVAVIKPNKLRICIDQRDLNEAIRREHFPMATTEEVVADMPQAKVISILDANSGYWQVKLDEAKSKLCLFNTPFGITLTPEVFQNHISELSAAAEGVKGIVDHLLLWGKEDEEHDVRFKQVLTKSKRSQFQV